MLEVTGLSRRPFVIGTLERVSCAPIPAKLRLRHSRNAAGTVTGQVRPGSSRWSLLPHLLRTLKYVERLRDCIQGPLILRHERLVASRSGVRSRVHSAIRCAKGTVPPASSGAWVGKRSPLATPHRRRRVQRVTRRRGLRTPDGACLRMLKESGRAPLTPDGASLRMHKQSGRSPISSEE